jgi:hypothetical protein
MKSSITILFLLFSIIFNSPILSQITSPVIRANFGVDAELRTNYKYNIVQFGTDDWFRSTTDFNSGGQFVIDTTGAFQILNNYVSNPATLNSSFSKPMRYPPYSIVNNRLLIDGYFVRDFHGNDSTMFASGSNKNGMSPLSWSCPVAQPVPDKNEILDAMLHVRRDGPNTTDSMWMFGGISIENTTGNRYFDFEMYQTDFSYDRAAQKFINYGPDAGHTSWLFDATGKIIQAGDIIFTAEYSSSALTFIEARIWVSQTTLNTVIPSSFNFTGVFDGDGVGAQYGYAAITPKFAGVFYTGLQSINNTWAGPYKLILGNNSIVDNYIARQYMEFSVNLTKLGLDEDGVFNDDNCLKPFRKVLIKTRASTSFTSALKDFVLPFAFFVAPQATLETETPNICNNGSIANIYVANSIATSIYHWSTPNGHIVGGNSGPSIFVDTPGIYIVNQYLNISCALYATDTIVINDLGTCNILTEKNIFLKGTNNNNIAQLQWKVTNQEFVHHYVLEKSIDGIHFTSIYSTTLNSNLQYTFEESIHNNTGVANVFYRVVIVHIDNRITYSKIVKINYELISKYSLKVQNAAAKKIIVTIKSGVVTKGKIIIYNALGQVNYQKNIMLHEGSNVFELEMNKQNHIIFAQCILPNQTLSDKILVNY